MGAISLHQDKSFGCINKASDPRAFMYATWAHTATMPTKIFDNSSHLTDKGIKAFLDDWAEVEKGMPYTFDEWALGSTGQLCLKAIDLQKLLDGEFDAEQIASDPVLSSLAERIYGVTIEPITPTKGSQQPGQMTAEVTGRSS